jgi:hypothetical protein
MMVRGGLIFVGGLLLLLTLPLGVLKETVKWSIKNAVPLGVGAQAGKALAQQEKKPPVRERVKTKMCDVWEERFDDRVTETSRIGKKFRDVCKEEQ